MIIGLTFVMLLAGCATAPQGPSLDERLRSLMGQPIASVIQSRGMPTQTMDVPGSGKAYMWAQQGPTVFFYGVAAPTGCQVTLFTDPANVVTNYQWRGNSCR